MQHFGVDYMHGICLNICKHFMSYWFSEKYNSHTFSLYQKKAEIQKHLNEFKFPHFKTRRPRNLDDFEDWKAVEFR